MTPFVGRRRHGEAQVVGKVDQLEPVPFVPGQRTKDPVRDDRAGRCPVVGDGGTQALRLLALAERRFGHDTRRGGDTLGQDARLQHPTLLLLGHTVGRIECGRGEQVHVPAQDDRQVTADLGQRPVADRSVTLQEPLDIGHDLVEALVGERPSSRGHGGILQARS